MNARNRIAVTVAAGAVVVSGCLAIAQAPPPTEPAAAETAKAEEIKANEPEWHFSVAATGWLLGIDGDVGVRGRTVNVSETFLDVVNESDSLFAFSGRVEVGYGKFGGYIDGMYVNIGLDNESGPLGFADVDVDVDQTILDFGVMYRIGEWEPSGEAAKNDLNMSLDLNVGGRYNGLEIKLTPANLAERKDDDDWVDPIVGARFIAPLSEHWHVSIAGDVGGFGVASDFAWSVTGLIGYDFHIGKAPSSVVAGYRAMGWDYTSGSGDEKFTWDVVESGLILGLVVRF